MPSYMILPSMACGASCGYCFGPHSGPVMTEAAARETVDYLAFLEESRGGDGNVSVTFHGGEPLLAPKSVWRILLEGLDRRFPGRLSLSVQSNLWNLDDEFCGMFRDHGVAVGTSLDGPREICDRNRGEGYWERTTAGMALAKACGLKVGAIATISRKTQGGWKEILEYFRAEDIDVSLHPALDGAKGPKGIFALTPEEYAGLVREMFPWYLEHSREIDISTLNAFASSCVRGESTVCTFRSCAGAYIAVGPTGGISSCQRFCGHTEHELGKIADRPGLDSLAGSMPARRQRERESKVAELCGDCEYFIHCRGGCYHNALENGDGVIDPLCPAYKEIFGVVRDRLLEEAASAGNRAAAAAGPPESGEHPLFRAGPMISLTKKIRPKGRAAAARRVLAWYQMGRTGDARSAAEFLRNERICGDPDETEALLRRGLCTAAEDRRLRNLYVHVTDGCNLRCAHCYMEAGEAGASGAGAVSMPAEVFGRLAREAVDLGVRKVSVTGGEPTIHPDRGTLFGSCRELRGRGTRFVLRTNLSLPFSDEDIGDMARSFDGIAVSVEGGRDAHDAIRGKGSFDAMLVNLERLAETAANSRDGARLSLACTLVPGSGNGPADEVEELGRRIGVSGVKVRPWLPLGRGRRGEGTDGSGATPGKTAGNCLRPLAAGSSDRFETFAGPKLSCGLGEVASVSPDGGIHPCYVFDGPESRLGEAGMGRACLEAVLSSDSFGELKLRTVDSFQPCSGCDVRYLCGGVCRAWDGEFDCAHLKESALGMVREAREYLLGTAG